MTFRKFIRTAAAAATSDDAMESFIDSIRDIPIEVFTLEGPQPILSAYMDDGKLVLDVGKDRDEEETPDEGDLEF